MNASVKVFPWDVIYNYDLIHGMNYKTSGRDGYHQVANYSSDAYAYVMSFLLVKLFFSFGKLF